MTTHQVLRIMLVGVTLFCSPLLLTEIPAAAQSGDRPRLLIQSGHHAGVNDVSYSPDGTLIATAGGDKKIKLWDAASRRLLNDLEGHSGEVSAIDFSPDGRLLASCGENNEVFIWDVRSGRLIHTLSGHESGVNSVAFSPDGKTLATAGGLYQEVSDNSIRIWDVQSGRQLDVLKGHSALVSHADFGLGGRVLVSAGKDKTVKLWSMPDGQLLNSINTPDYVDTLAVFPGGRSFATISNRSMTVSDMQGRQLSTLNLPGPATVLAFSRDASTFAFNCANESCVEIRSFPSGQLISKLEGVVQAGEEYYPPQNVNALSFSPDGKTLLTGADDSSVKLWGRVGGRLLGTLAPSAESSGALSVSPDGRTIAVGSGGKIVFWDAQGGRQIRSFQGHTDTVRALAFSRDGTKLASVGSAEGLKVWSTADGRLLWSFRGEEDDDFGCVIFNPDSRLIAIAGDYVRIKLLDAKSGRLMKTLTVPLNAAAPSTSPFVRANFARPRSGPGAVLSVAFSPDSSLLAAGDLGYPLNIWDVSSGKHLRTIENQHQTVYSVVFSPDGKALISGDEEKTIKFWSVADGTMIRRTAEADSVRSVALAPDGGLVAASNASGSISLRNASDGSLIRELKGHALDVDTVVFSPDGKTLISGGDDATTKIWSAGDGRLLTTLISFKDGNWLTVTPDGFYDGPAGALQYVSWRSGDRLYGEAQYRQQFNRPEIVKARIGSAVAPSVFVASASPLPTPQPEAVSPTVSMDESLRRQLPAKKFYALVIGNNNYRYMKSLKTAVKDAEDVAKALADNFGFQTKLLRNATREEIMGEINRLRRELDGESNLLIYYAGHGYLDEKVKKAYWWPVNAAREDGTEWISADDITISLKGMDAKHVLVVSDSCYSGAIPRGEVVGTSYRLTERERYLRKMMFGTSRTLIASGGVEPVEDDDRGNGHSVFANAFLNGLQKFEANVFTAEELFYEYIRIPVAGKSGQEPQFDPLYNSGHDSGAFVFFRKW